MSVKYTRTLRVRVPGPPAAADEKEEWSSAVQPTRTPAKTVRKILPTAWQSFPMPGGQRASRASEIRKDTTRSVGAGHLPETPLPWLDGNSVIAGHRDTDFRPLRRIREGDMIRFRAADTAIDYVVRETTIVAPTDVTVLRPTSRSVLTLITCYPFTYIGPAPKRFIVRAVRVSNASDNATTHDR